MEDIAKRFQRMISILRHLSTGGSNSGRLAGLYNVSQRTIQRDIIDLRRAGFNIETNGRRHVLIGGERIPGQTLELSEMLSLALGSCLLGKEDDTALGSTGNQALLKLAAFVKGDKKLQLRDFPQSVAVGGPSANEAWFPELLRAIAEKHTVQFHYHSPGPATADPLVQRKVDPWTLLYQSSAWYLQGYDHHRQASRTFRLNRIRDFEASHEIFSIPSQHRADEAVFHRWDLFEARRRKVLCRVSPELGRWLEENPVHPSQRIEDGVLELHVRDLERVASWALGLTGIEVLQPGEMRKRMRQRALKIAEAHRLPHDLKSNEELIF